MKKKRWRFAIPPRSRKALTPGEEEYWLSIMKKILKVGIEFEFNLPEKKGTCSYPNGFCTCINMHKCEKKCAHISVCSKQGDCSLCIKTLKGKCGKSNKVRCEDFELACEVEKNMMGIPTCSDLIMPCIDCDEFQPPCVECSLKRTNRSPEEVRAELERLFCPSGFVATVGKYGVLAITKDGSLKADGGLEMVTVGRRPHFPTMYRMCKRMLEESMKRDAYLDQRCSIHVHLLAGYLDKEPIDKNKDGRYSPITISELERAVPEIILTNCHQLIRKYQNALVWLSAGLDLPEYPSSITRWGKFRYPLLEYSALQQRISTISEELKMKHRKVYGPGTNTFMNYSLCKFEKDGDVSTFHIEARYMDGTFSAAATVAFAILHYALVIKAIEISRMGILEAGDKSEMKSAREIQNALMNNCTAGWDSNRVSDNGNIDAYKNLLEEQSKELVYLLKGTLEEFPPAYDILLKLSERPIAYRLRDYRDYGENKRWELIESDLIGSQATNEEADNIKNSIVDLIKMNTVIECETADEWIENIQNVLEENETVNKSKRKMVIDIINEMTESGSIFWSNSVGAFINRG